MSALPRPGVGCYAFYRCIGVGSYGTVMYARHSITNKPAAVKIVPHNERCKERVRHELNVLAQLCHPHIARLHEAIATPHAMHAVMEYASGGDLHDYVLHRGVLGEGEARRLFAQLASAVHHCHVQLHIAHLDIKAANVLLDGHANVKLADFGLSMVFAAGHTRIVSAGSPFYAAPEVYLGTPVVGPECDMWGLGVVLYVMVTGCLPFGGRCLDDVRSAVVHTQYAMPSSISSACASLIARLLVHTASDRAAAKTVMADAWVGGNGWLSVHSVCEAIVWLGMLFVSYMRCLVARPAAANHDVC